MFKELANVIKVTKSKHLFKALTSPSHTIRKFKYHYRRVSERNFVEFFAKHLGCPNGHVESLYRDFDRNCPFWEEIKGKLSSYPNGYGLQMTQELPSLYMLIRLLKPKRVLETGVASGASSAYVLRALHDNGKGKLYSIDLPPDDLPIGKTVGWIVSEDLRERWSLYIGDARNLLKSIFDEIREFDCFIHDSLHTYDHMTWEFNTAWKYLRPGGLFLSHDVGANDAFFDFMSDNGISWRSYRVFHVLGGFIKPP